MKQFILFLGCLCLSLSVFTVGQAQKPELVVPVGHTEAINSIAFSPDGKLLASVSEDKKIVIWEVETGKELRTTFRLSGAAKAVAFSPDNKTIVTGSVDGSIDLLEISSERVLHTLKDQSVSVAHVAFSLDGRNIVSEYSDGTIKVWDAVSGKQLRTIQNELHDSRSAFASSPDGKTFAAVGKDDLIKLWDANAGTALNPLKSSGLTMAIAFSPDGLTLASMDHQKGVKLWDVARRQESHAFGFTPFMNFSLAFSPNGKLLAGAATIDGEIKLWDIATGQALTLIGPGLQVSCLAFSPDGKTIAAGYADTTDVDTKQSKEIQLWDVATGQKLRTFTGGSRAVFSVAFSRDARIIAAASEDNTVKLWDLRTGRGLSTLVGHSNSVSSVAFTADDKMLASGGLDGMIKLWEIASGREIRNFSEFTAEASKPNEAIVSYVAFSPDGNRLMSFTQGDVAQNVKMWEVNSGKVLRTIGSNEFKDTGEYPHMQAAALSPDGKVIVASSRDAIKVWDSDTGRVLHTMTGQANNLAPIIFSPDSETFTTMNGEDKTTKIWSVRTGKVLRTLNVATDPLSFSGNGKRLVLVGGSQHETITLWDVVTDKEIRTLKGHQTAVPSVAFSPDQKYLVSGSFDTTMKVWDISTGTELASVIALDQKEWVVVTPDGLFDGSPTAWNSIRWRFSKNLYDFAPIEAFFNEFYHPNLLADIFAGTRPKAPSDISQKDRRQPQLKVTLSESQSDAPLITRKVTVRIGLSQAPAGARDVRLFRNGSLVKLWRGDVLKGQGSVTLEATVLVVAGENRFTAYAFNRDNIKSSDATLIVTGADSLKRSGAAYVLAVGVNTYNNPKYNLKYAVPDAEDFSAELKRQQETLKKYERIEVVPLYDREATKANILQKLSELSNKAQPEDAVIVYFSGHGTAAQQRFYLIPHDLGYEGPRTKLSEATLRSILNHSISDRELEAAFERIDAGQFLMVIDACNSGQALDSEEKRRGPMNSKGLAQLAYEKGMYILTAAQSYQAAWEASRLGHGFLTYALVEEGLKQGTADREPKNNEIMLREWLDYATERVPQLQEEKLKETPQQRDQQGRELEFVFVEGDESIKDPTKRTIQRPRVFYRRELETSPLIVAKPQATRPN